MKLASVILNYNSAEDCRKCVDGLKRQSVVPEIIIVDNCSRQEECDAAEELCRHEQCTFLKSSENRGYNAGNNIGLRCAAERGFEYVLIANPDMEFPSSSYVKELVEKMDSDPDLAVVASDILHIDGYHQNPYLPDGDWKTNFGWITGVFKPTVQKDALFFCDDWKQNHECVKVSGCCFLIRLSFVEKIGFFDEYPMLYCEEAILSKQVQRAGMKMFYLAGSQGVHRHIVKNKGKANPRLKQFLRSRLYFIRKYTDDPWYGKVLASLSWICYLRLLMLYNLFRGK